MITKEISNLRKNLFNLDRNGRFDYVFGFYDKDYRNGLPQRIDLRFTANDGNGFPLPPGFLISTAETLYL